MTNQLESDLRDALAAHVSGLPAGAEARLSGIDYHPRTGRLSPGVMVGSLAGVAAATGVVVSVATLVGAQPAFAGWLPQPTPAATGQMSSALATCRGQLAARSIPGTAAVSGWNQVATDVRGPFTLSVYQSASAVASCLTGPSITIVSQSSTNGVATSESGRAGGSGRGQGGGSVMFGGSGSGSIEHVSVAQFDSDSQGPYTVVEGQVTTGVTVVMLQRSDGEQVQATTTNGWFIAWWPGDQTTSAALVTTAGGTSTQSLNLAPALAPGPPPAGGTCAKGPATAPPKSVCSGGSVSGGSGGSGSGGGATTGGPGVAPSTATATGGGGPSLNSNR